MATQAELQARIDAINQAEKERRAAAAARKAKLLLQLKAAARPTKSQRRLDARRKILLGAFVLEQLEHSGSSPQALTFQGKRFLDWLIRPNDRAVFEAPPPATSIAEGSSSPAASARPNGSSVLNVPYPDKDQAKALGAQWHAAQKRWVVPPGMDLAPFERWITRNDPA